MPAIGGVATLVGGWGVAANRGHGPLLQVDH